MSDLVCIKVFANYYEATITRGLIEDNGIKAIVLGRDTARPDLELSQGVRLWVKKEDAEKALEILKISKEH